MPSQSKPVKGRILAPSYSFTRPSDTTQYASGDLVANSTTAANVVALSWLIAQTAEGTIDGYVRRVRMWSSDNDTTSASFRLHFYSRNPVSTAPTNGDNGAYAMAVTDGNSIYLGSVDISFDRTVNNSDAYGAGVPTAGNEINFTDVGTLYALIEARGTYTPASAEVLTIVPEIHAY
jgi:hypothetical protein